MFDCKDGRFVIADLPTRTLISFHIYFSGMDWLSVKNIHGSRPGGLLAQLVRTKLNTMTSASRHREKMKSPRCNVNHTSTSSFYGRCSIFSLITCDTAVKTASMDCHLLQRQDTRASALGRNCRHCVGHADGKRRHGKRCARVEVGLGYSGTLKTTPSS